MKSCLLSAAVVATLAVGCSGSSATTRVDGSLTAQGVTGPAKQPSHLYVLKGYPAVVRAVQGGRTVVTTQTRPDGAFTLTLKPGNYTITGMWKYACRQPCDCQARACGQSGQISVGRHQVRNIDIVCK